MSAWLKNKPFKRAVLRLIHKLSPPNVNSAIWGKCFSRICFAPHLRVHPQTTIAVGFTGLNSESFPIALQSARRDKGPGCRGWRGSNCQCQSKTSSLGFHPKSPKTKVCGEKRWAESDPGPKMDPEPWKRLSGADASHEPSRCFRSK